VSWGKARAWDQQEGLKEESQGSRDSCPKHPPRGDFFYNSKASTLNRVTVHHHYYRGRFFFTTSGANAETSDNPRFAESSAYHIPRFRFAESKRDRD